MISDHPKPNPNHSTNVGKKRKKKYQAALGQRSQKKKIFDRFIDLSYNTMVKSMMMHSEAMKGTDDDQNTYIFKIDRSIDFYQLLH